MNDSELKEYLIDCVLNDENCEMLMQKIYQVFNRLEQYEEVLKEIADKFAFEDVYDEVTTKRFMAKQVLERFQNR